MSWIGVYDAEQVQEDFPYSGNIDGKEIGIYLIDGEYYALEDVCPHAYALLSQGFVEDGKVECPLHEAVFDVKTGQCLHGPGGRNLNRYPVRVYDNQIQITFIEENVA
ncbi:non-heme iron oxygenase ferredoxin subunit [Klebsiella pneumoniae]|uniref:Rieske (2Fe-2S) protein n=1 Tax=Klebsiella quasipneumoniae TaxID=1463165 RepID=UPI00292B9BA5|nr:non-heme iron oxygenase ferredoxin subunit [Klebsiella quasipneumoniae]MDV1055108.1 non-heme iron oxygenase ferredoxin subunit [Klebsiella quasipneumoniae subsp. similipneumoniae]MDX4834453.1 non-heme iron oxygenase ferredoxin subunit [Klebsiella pneumoniae]HDE1467172.1 non-heme iron oxygenase ferredoxin subunit [Klebsiella quasipneumoniae]